MDKQNSVEAIPQAKNERPFDIDCSGWKRTKIKSIYLENFGRHKKAFFDFTTSNEPLRLACLVGPNGSGKTTVLTAVQLLFNSYSDYDAVRYESMMTKYVRNYFSISAANMAKANFLLRGVFTSGGKDYEVAITRKEILNRHPPEIECHLSRYCHAARFDQELHMFQIKRERWSAFKTLFFSVTGFQIEEVPNVFDSTSDKRVKKINDEYVTNFKFLNKDDDIFTNRLMSAGERKVTKCFSTIYNLSVPPCVILIDNVTDHIELSRHLPLMTGLEGAFQESQIIATCHSASVQRNYDRNLVYDMRFLNANPEICASPWKLRLADEIMDSVDKVIYSKKIFDEKRAGLRTRAESIVKNVLDSSAEKSQESVATLKESIKVFMSEIYKEYVVDDLMEHPPLKLRGG